MITPDKKTASDIQVKKSVRVMYAVFNPGHWKGSAGASDAVSSAVDAYAALPDSASTFPSSNMKLWRVTDYGIRAL